MLEQAGTEGICRIRTDRQDHAGIDQHILEQPGKLKKTQDQPGQAGTRGTRNIA